MSPRTVSFSIITLTWITALAAVFFVIKVFKIGPVIFVISEQHGWGVHSGDFLALIPIAVALAATFALSRITKKA